MASCKLIVQKPKSEISRCDHLVVILPTKLVKSDGKTVFHKSIQKTALSFWEGRKKQRLKDGRFSGDLSAELRLSVHEWKDKSSTFEALSWARKFVASYERSQKVLVDLSQLDASQQSTLIDVITAAHITRYDYQKPVVKSKEDKKPVVQLTIGCLNTVNEKKVFQKSLRQSEASNLARQLFEMPANVLDCKALKAKAKEVSTAVKAKFEFIDKKKLEKLGAGAFLAVARGSNHNDAGIAKLSFGDSKTKGPHLVFVGKGVVYDTGGVNLKPAQYMFGMQGDMGGAAVALSCFQAAVLSKFPGRITCYLAISDNAIGSNAYRPNEVVKTISGKTIETVHTDAEGRMMLVDTLTIASEDKYDLLIDFATLTGSCVRAIGTQYSGAFTNDPKWHQNIIESSRSSGERLWPFPMDEDLGRGLKSRIADLKQCLLNGGVDHIEAAHLLKQFVRDDRPWVHIDLSSAENEGGLAHVPFKVTGFGVRAGLSLAESILFSEKKDS